MPDGSFKEVSLADYKGKYLVFFFYPLGVLRATNKSCCQFTICVNLVRLHIRLPHRNPCRRGSRNSLDA